MKRNRSLQKKKKTNTKKKSKTMNPKVPTTNVKDTHVLHCSRLKEKEEQPIDNALARRITSQASVTERSLKKNTKKKELRKKKTKRQACGVYN